MKIMTVDKANIEQEHICCAIGNDKRNRARAQVKKDWMKKEFDNGLVFKRLDDRGKMFIEYMPIEDAWKPVIGKNYMMIHCLWVSGKFKKQGIATAFLDECISESKDKGKDGIAVITSSKNKPFLTEKKFFEKKGFQVVDQAPPYFELMVLKINKKAENPSFTSKAKTSKTDFKDGICFIYTHQCPFMEEYMTLLSKICEEETIPVKIIKLKNADEVKEIGSPFGTYAMFDKGEFVTHELFSENKFRKYLKAEK